MGLTSEEKDALIAALGQKNALRACEACGNVSFNLAQALGHVPLSTPGYFKGTAGFPAAAVVCTNCGNVRMHVLSILDPELAAYFADRGDG